LAGEQVFGFTPEHSFSEPLDFLLSAFVWLWFPVLLKRAACSVFGAFGSPPFVSSNLLRVVIDEAGLVLKLSDERLEFSGFLLYFYGGFSVTLTRCSMKYA
jgi:hypothetical protein